MPIRQKWAKYITIMLSETKGIQCENSLGIFCKSLRISFCDASLIADQYDDHTGQPVLFSIWETAGSLTVFCSK